MYSPPASGERAGVRGFIVRLILPSPKTQNLTSAAMRFLAPKTVKMQTPQVLLFLFCLVLSFVLSGMEAGLFSLSRWRIRHQARSGNKRAEVLLGFLQRPEHFLWTILVGNSIANVTVFSLLVFWYYQWLSPWPLV